jgi:mannose-1-phosphate guanylyltransferase
VLHGVILAGGRGERFWPLSRSNRPKQFLKLLSDKAMLEETIDRILPLVPMERIHVVTASSMETLVVETIPSISTNNVLVEPVGRNTCAAIGLAALHLLHDDPEANLIVLSADHLVKPADRLLDILREGAAITSNQDYLITMGIVPTRAETGYGYIRTGDVISHQGVHHVHKVSAFTEKPRLVVAKEYYFSGQYLWNSGMFIWSAASFLSAIHRFQPAMAALFEEYQSQIGTPAETEARQRLYDQISPISVDFAVLEKADNVLTIKADIVWDDVGDWNALQRNRPQDGENNVLIGYASVLDTFETTVFNDADGLVACVGVSDLVIVRSGDITLVVHKTKAQNIKELLAKLSEDDRNHEYL